MTLVMIRRYAEYVANSEPVSQAAIAISRNKYTDYMGRTPNEIRLGGSAMRDMLKEVQVDRAPETLRNESIQGLLIVADDKLKPDEWLVGTSNEQIRSIQ